jgi:erythromycin esterase-like protein
MRRRLLVVTLSALGAGALVLWLRHLPAVPTTRPEVLTALATIVTPLTTDYPAADDRDLEPLLPLLAGRRVVALGEATHGTREFFRLKDRLVRFLVRRAGFTTFALEISPEGAQAVGRYIDDGTGDPKQAVGRFEFWTWHAEEVLALVDWMRAWNAVHGDVHPVSLVGINAPHPSRDARMAQNVERALSAAGPQGRVIVWAHNGHVATDPGRMGHYLRQSLGVSLYVLGFEFSEGSFRSRTFRSLCEHHVPAAGPSYYGSTLARLSSPIVYLDFGSAARAPVVAEWLAAPRRSRDIDELFYLTRLSERWYSRADPWPELYNGVLFVRRTTAARGLFGPRS